MILLDNSAYDKVIKPLNKVYINNLFARSVVEHHVSGKIYVDDHDAPRTFYIVHPYGMSLLLGDSNNSKFNAEFRDYALNTNNARGSFEWMQAFPDNWHEVLQLLFNDYLVKSSENKEGKETGIIEVNARVNFRFNREKYLDFRNKINLTDYQIIRTDRKLFREMRGIVVPMYFWNNEVDFSLKGVGFSLFYNNQLASTAFSAYVIENKLELGIETIPEFRKKGFAQIVCAAIIDYCIENNLEPVWSCRLENKASYYLAQRIGFEPVLEIPYYRLSK
jgi:GNAT superfamily N-acetyltransferase